MQFVVPGPPVPWARAGQNGRRKFTPAKQKKHMGRVVAAAKAAGARPLSCPVMVTVHAYWPCPSSLRRVRTPYRGGWRPGRPDPDNIAKIILDSLNGVAYVDDDRVVKLYVQKRYAAQDEEARTVVTVTAIDSA